MTTKGIEFLRNLKPEDMPFTGEVYERLKDYLIIKRVSDEKYYEDYIQETYIHDANLRIRRVSY